MKRSEHSTNGGRQLPRILVLTDRVGADLANGAQVFANAVLCKLARWFDLTVIAQAAVRPAALAGKVLVISPDDEASVSTRLVNELDLNSFPLIYNLGGTSFSCHLARLASDMAPFATVVNHFQVVLSEYARHEGWSNEQAGEEGRVQPAVAERAHTNIFPSFSELNLAAANGWQINHARSYVAPNAFVDAGAKPAAQPEGPFTFLAAARFSDYVKGADLLYRAFVDVRRRHPTARLVIAGDDRRFLEVLNPLPRDSWEFLGWLNRRELHAAMSAADAVVVPSRYEPFGLVALEAMAMGTPVVAMAVGGLAEIVHHEITGWLCPPWEGSLGLSMAMDAAASDRQRAWNMGREARALVKRDYDLNRCVQQVRTHLDNALAAEGARSTQISIERLSSAQGS